MGRTTAIVLFTDLVGSTELLRTYRGRIFVGRDAEIERLQQLSKEAVAGERRVALLAGELWTVRERRLPELERRAAELRS